MMGAMHPTTKSAAQSSCRWLLRAVATLVFALPVHDIAGAQSADTSLGSNVKGLLLAGRRLSPGLRAVALDTEAAAAKAGGAGALDAAIDAARTRRTLADKASDPDVTIGAGPVIQTNNRPVGFAATVGLNIPLPWGREGADQHEAAQLGATQQRYDEARLEIEGALGETLAKLQAVRATERLLLKETLPQARASFESVMANYSQGKGDLTVPIAAERKIRDVEFRLLQAQLDEQVVFAAIERLIGGDL